MPDSVDAGPSPDALASVFQVHEVRRAGDRLLYFGDPLVPRERLVRAAWPLFHEHGYELSITRRPDGFVLVAEPNSVGVDGVPWTNIALLLATIVTTLYAGAGWYYVRDPLSPAIVHALPFTLAVLGVLGTHELGHYLMSRYHDVDASLPYFIPMAPPIGTMGAVIRMKGQIPDRKALFDIGVAGPVAGLVATVVVTAVGLTLPPVTVPDWMLAAQDPVLIHFNYPPLLEGLAWLLGEPLSYPDERTMVNPVVFGGWVGMFVTFLNLLPVGQLDGGHVLRAILGRRQETVAAAVPGVLFALAGYLHFVRGVSNGAGIWVFWGFLTLVIAYVGPADPVQEGDMDAGRVAVGVLTLLVGALCFTPLPIQIVT